MIRELTYYGDPLLRQKAAIIPSITEGVRDLYQDMCDTMEAHKGVGLAAPQVGQSIRMFVTCVEGETEGGDLLFSKTPKVFINPVLSEPSKVRVAGVEGCLSIPGLRGEVMRPDSITVESLDLSGNLEKTRYEGFVARVIMHENDHLNGVLYIDRMSEKAVAKLKKALEKIKKKYARNLLT